MINLPRFLLSEDIQTALFNGTLPASSLVIFFLCRGRIPFWKLAAAMFALPIGSVFLGFTLQILPRLLHNTYDVRLSQIDGALGFQPVAYATLAFKKFSPLRCACLIAYQTLLLSIAFSAAHELRLKNQQGLEVLPIFFIAGFFGYVVYFVVPAVGPSPFFGTNLPLLLSNPNLPGGEFDISDFPRNCVPSLHTTWAILAFLGTRGQSLTVRITSGIFAALVLTATLGFAAHYLTDLIVAAPFILFIRALCASQLPWKSERLRGVVTGLVLMTIWCVAIRGDVPVSFEGGIIPIFMLITLAVSIYCESLLARAERYSRDKALPPWFLPGNLRQKLYLGMRRPPELLLKPGK